MTSANWLDFLVFSDKDKKIVPISQHFHLSGSCQWDVKEPMPTIPGLGVLSVRIGLNS